MTTAEFKAELIKLAHAAEAHPRLVRAWISEQMSAVLNATISDPQCLDALAAVLQDKRLIDP